MTHYVLAGGWRKDRLNHSRRPGDALTAGIGTGTVDENDILDCILPHLLSDTIAVAEALNGLLDLKYRSTLSETQQDWRDRAADFWQVVA